MYKVEKKDFQETSFESQSAVKLRASPIFIKKNQVFFQKSPTFFSKQPIFLYLFENSHNFNRILRQ